LLAIVGLHRQSRPRLEPVEHRRKGVFGDGKHDADRLKLGDHDQAIGVAHVHDVARVHETESQASADRRRDVAVSQLEPGGLDHPLVGLDRALVLAHQGFLGVELLLGDRVLGVQRPVARQVGPGVLEECLVTSQLPVGLGQLHLEGAGVDLGERVPGANDVTLAEPYHRQLAVHPALHRDCVDRRDRAQPGEMDTDVAGSRRHGRDGHRASRGSRISPGGARAGFPRPDHERPDPRRRQQQSRQHHDGAPDAGSLEDR
jgi:hypothetical protein